MPALTLPRAAGALAAMLVTLAGSGCGDSSDPNLGGGGRGAEGTGGRGASLGPGTPAARAGGTVTSPPMPSGPVATVAGTSITRADYDRVRGSLARSSLCQQAVGSAKSGACSPAALARQALGLLIDARWLKLEAARRHVAIPGGRFDAVADQVGLGDLIARLAPALPGRVADGQARAYYRAHRSELVAPLVRDFQVATFPVAATASRARAAVGRGESFSAVAGRVSPGTKATVLKNVSRGNVGPFTRPVMFATPVGHAGSFSTRFGTTVYKVLSSRGGGPPPSYRRARRQVEASLRVKRDQQRTSALLASVRRRWQPQTMCAPAYFVELCAHAPKRSK